MSNTLTPLVWCKKELKLWKEDLKSNQKRVSNCLEENPTFYYLPQMKKELAKSKRMVKIFKAAIEKLSGRTVKLDTVIKNFQANCKHDKGYITNTQGPSKCRLCGKPLGT